jgi:lipid-binding SYLF domain-containing protein
MLKRNNLLKIFTFLAMLSVVSGCVTPASALNRSTDQALQEFRQQVNGADVFLNQAAGYLVFPKVYKAGIGVGGETGEGVLRVGGSPVDYYRVAAGSVGFQLGAQAKSIVIVFMTREALERFRKSDGWRVGVDGSVALIDIGAGKTIDSDNVRDPVVGFIYGSKGLMYNLTLEGTKFTKIDR